MADRFDIAIIGSGPAGLSAACRAAKRSASHILLERAAHVSDTISRYQKRKLVMATPAILPLRSDTGFAEGAREVVLDVFGRAMKEAGVNLRLNTEVTGVSGAKGAFRITLKSGEAIEAGSVVLAIGVQGNIRRLTVPGSEQSFVQYQLDDPDEYQNESIVVIGGGDAGIENALGLVAGNAVTLVVNSPEFVHAKPANIAKVQDEVKAGRMETVMAASPARIEPGRLILNTPQGEATVKVDRIIARIGALPPRKFVEACGVAFASEAPTAAPLVSETYESSVPGLYIVGALAGYPLIKNCLNQGYEVVEHILGNAIAPADEPLIEGKLAKSGLDWSVGQLVQAVKDHVPLFRAITPLQVREILTSSDIHRVDAGAVLFRRNDYTNSVFAVVAGAIGVEVDPEKPEALVRLGAGSFVGEMGLISGRRRTATVTAIEPSALLEVPRNTMLRLTRSVPDIKQQIDEVAIVRQFRAHIAPTATPEALAPVVERSKVVAFKAGETLIKEGDVDDRVFLIRSGAVTISKLVGRRDIVLSYVQAGHYVGEMAMLTRSPRSASVRASVATEAIEIEAEPLRALLAKHPEVKSDFSRKMAQRGVETARLETRASGVGAIGELLKQGLGEATDVLMIDESLCVHCNNCESACAETHGGISRLDREAGPTFATIHVPTSCRHCEHPHCMKDCPPDALSRSKEGEVFINPETCIGCGNCERNCPYGVIHMAQPSAKKPGLLSWLLFGSGPGPGGSIKGDGAKKAVKCDLCMGIDGGPACVRACPTGAAMRAHPQKLFDLIKEGGR
ncbi:MAG: cyclic nucleotide-binding domain-containing protein [Alphaproteobacteria bacterium]|nr:cyclic nucleotide-binding domain-containing protein [Alphaproteobacteria bacterium]